MNRAVSYRGARPDDLLTCAQIWSTSIEAYVRRLNQPWFTGDLEPLRRLLAHFLVTDPERFRVATDGAGPSVERVVGFGSATMRDRTWFLGMLFVLPEYQAVGVGRALLEQVMPSRLERDVGEVALGTATDSVQPISNALYTGYGLVPRLPVFNFVGRPDRPDAFPAPPDGVEITETAWGDGARGNGSPAPSGDNARDAAGDADADPDTAQIAALDRAVIGYDHPQDHAFLRAEGRRRFLARSERAGLLGYGYMAPSGRFGPIAALDPALLAPLTGHMLANVRAAGAYATWVPGAADDLFVCLLRAGFRFESFPALFLWDRPIADFSRYVPINLALV